MPYIIIRHDGEGEQRKLESHGLFRVSFSRYQLRNFGASGFHTISSMIV